VLPSTYLPNPSRISAYRTGYLSFFSFQYSQRGWERREKNIKKIPQVFLANNRKIQLGEAQAREISKGRKKKKRDIIQKEEKRRA